MINISYTPANPEFAAATAAFLLQRPTLRLMLSVSRVACVMVIIGFSLCLYADAVTYKNVISTILAILWMLFYRKVLYAVINSVIRSRDVNKIPFDFNIDKKRIFCKNAKVSSQVEWKTIKFIIDTYTGYIIPLTGVNNAGRFLWLPKRAFSDNNQEQDFLKILSSLNKSIKKTRWD